MATAAEKNPNSAKSAPDLEADIRQLKAELEKLTKQFAATGERGYGTARRVAAQSAEQLRVQGEAAMESLHHNAKDLEAHILERVREKPVTALAIAAGVGFLFALMARR